MMMVMHETLQATAGGGVMAMGRPSNAFPGARTSLSATHRAHIMSKIVKGIAYGGGIIAFGYALLKYTVPSEEEMQKVRQMLCCQRGN